MGFYLRKSISVGPLRFNLSKSGVGVSAGVKGLRFGAGPRGNYVHMGRGGLYYRATLPNSKTPENAGSPRQPKLTPPLQEASRTHGPLEEIESSDVSQMTDSSSKELLDELNRKRARARLWPAIAIIFIAAFLVGVSSNWPTWVQLVLIVGGFIGTYVTHNLDTLAKTVVLFYDFDSQMEAAYTRLHSAMSQLSNCAAVWHIEASGKVYDRKYHAGASDLVQRKGTFFRKKEPPYVKTNIETIAVDVGRQTLHFFPDRVLVYASNGVGAIGYQDLMVKVGTTRFVEDGSVPRDSQIVDRTWKYVNKSGGPDRRFKDNRELPVCLYEEVSLSSSSGLNEVIQVSRCGAGNDFAEAISLLGKSMPVERAGAAQVA